MKPLQGLEQTARSFLDENFRSGVTEEFNAFEHLVDLKLGRSVDVEPLITIVDEAMRRFRSEPEASDAWLAPRVHATLRLSRREASDKRIWSFLNAVAKPDYVRWRYKADAEEGIQVPLDRFVGEESKNAFARLWWAAELLRNGSDYSNTQILTSIRFFTSWLVLDAMHHRPATLAVARFWREFNDRKGMTDWQSQRFAKAFNLRLSTLALDALASNPPVDSIAIKEWCEERFDEMEYFESMPIGPDEDPMPVEGIDRVYAVMDSLANEIGLADMKGPSSSKRKSEETTAAESTKETTTI